MRWLALRGSNWVSASNASSKATNLPAAVWHGVDGFVHVTLAYGCADAQSMRTIYLWLGLTALSIGPLNADTQLAIETQLANAVAKYGITGEGVIVAILDRGIDYTHPDFRHPDGTTRILYLLDMSGQNLCASNNPAPLEYNAVQINAALQGGTPLNTRDAVGHGTVTAGIAAGNGRAIGAGEYAGMAPAADLLIVKVTSEGAPAHGTQMAESAFQGCYSQALDWVIGKANLVGEPVVALINSGTQWGPIDGTSALSQKIDQDFGSNEPGRVYVEASGDEGTLPNHAGTDYTASGPITVNISKIGNATSYLQIWYTGSQPANITMTFADDGAVVGPVGPGGSASSDGITIFQYNPGQQFYPWTSSGPDRAVWIQVEGHSGVGTLQIQGTQPGSGHADFYSDATPVISFTDHLVAGRLSDYSSSSSAIVTGCYNLRTSWVDIDGNPQSLTSQGSVGQLWTFSSGGPTRDGRIPPAGGVDLTTPGGNVFAAYAQNSYWETFRSNLVQDGGGWYGRQSATSGASPITAGAVALLLEMNPGLTEQSIKTILHNTSISDSFTGATPNSMWGLGKLGVLAAADAVAEAIPANPAVSPGVLVFPNQQVGTTSNPISITLSNTGTAPLRVISISTSGDFIQSTQDCSNSVPAGGSCTISVQFRPSGIGDHTGTLTIRDINVSSPQTVMLTGTGNANTTHFSVMPSSSTASLGTPIQFTVTALDSSNATVASYSDPVHFASSDASAALPPNATLVSGVGTFSASLVTPGTQSLTVTDVFAPSIAGTSSGINVVPATGFLFVPITPCRVADTRLPAGPFGGPFISAGGSRSFIIPSSACGIPVTAQAFSLNVAVVPHSSLGFLTVWPTGQARPQVATLNSLDGRIKSNAAIVPAGTGGAISVFGTNDTDVILDINGYFVPSNTVGSLAFYPMTPCRLVDTRNGTLLSGSFTTGQTRTLPILSSTCAVPATAQAYSLNFVAVPPARVGFLTAFPTGVARPVVATLNDVTGTIAANAAIVPAGTGGSIDVFASDATQLVVDINGYYAPPGTGGLSLYNLPPCRVFDTRLPSGAPPITGELDINVLASVCGGTPVTQAYVFNATVVPTASLGFLTLWPQGTTRPVVATLNALDGAITNNLAVVPTINTQVSAFASDSTHLILDLFGYFAP